MRKIYGFESWEQPIILRDHLNMGMKRDRGEEINVTSLYLTKNGKPWIPVMGEYHFSRDHRQNWYRELCKMKAGGLDIVATYVLWIYHEEEEGYFDFSGDLDLGYFLECAQKAGLQVLLRIGPWAHGECRNGGFPDWLLQKGFSLRTDDPGYLHYAEIFYQKIYEQAENYLYPNGGPILGIQLENELTDNACHLLTLKKMAVDIGFRVPLYTVTGWNNIYGARIPVDDVLPVFAAYVEAPWADHIHKLPLSRHFSFDPVRNDSAVGMDLIGKCDDNGWRLPYEKYPFATCELGPGLQMTHHRRVKVSPMDAYVLSLVKLGCGNNLVGYYMYHGGINRIGKNSTFQETISTGYPNNYPVLNYDFQTCLSSYGQAREQYGLLNLLHLFTHDRGEKLAGMTHVGAEEFVEEKNLHDLRYAMRTDGKSGYIFVNHYQKDAGLSDCHDVVFKAMDVTFPSIDVRGEIAFILPFHLDMIRWATAQYLCREDYTYFFMEIPGIPAAYCLEDGREYTVGEACSLESAAEDSERNSDKSFHHEMRTYRKRSVTVDGQSIQIVTLTMKQAVSFRHLQCGYCFGIGESSKEEGCNIYEQNDRIQSIGDGPFSYALWQQDHFTIFHVEKECANASYHLEECEPAFEIPYPEELQYGYPVSPAPIPRKITWKRLIPEGDRGFVEICEDYDVAQIYADGKLAADHFYSGQPWEVPIELLTGRECYLVMSERRNDIFIG